ncbi:hypothetical protein DMENIID0001_077080 [Sergentomyia squamirostris]
MTRYSDTTLLIHDEWIRGHEKVAFPTVYAFVFDQADDEEDDKSQEDLQSNGILQQQQEEKFMRIRGQKVGYKYNNRDIRRPNGLSRRRRSREIAEKRSSRKSVELRIEENDPPAEAPLEVTEVPQASQAPEEQPPVDPQPEKVEDQSVPKEEVEEKVEEKASEPQETEESLHVQISADVHSAPATDINENIEDPKKETVVEVDEVRVEPTKSPVPESSNEEPDEILAIVEPFDEVVEIRPKTKDTPTDSPQSLRHISRTSSTSSRSGARSPIPGTVIGVPIRRKQYTSISETSFDDATSSSYDESDEPDYAKVEHPGVSEHYIDSCFRTF